MKFLILVTRKLRRRRKEKQERETKPHLLALWYRFGAMA